MIKRKVLNLNPFIATLDNVISPEIIRQMVSENDYVNSFGYVHDSKSSGAVNNRTSMSCFDLNNKYDNVRKIVLNCLETEFNVRHSIDACETWQFTQYSPGQYYKSHWDFFNVNDSRYINSVDNDRVATVIIYLNDLYTGGTTNFTKLNLSVIPKAGKILYFKYPTVNGDSHIRDLTLHEGAVVHTGIKRIATMWIRESAIIPGAII
jgi:prolyl 4-hydroxylase